MIKRMIVAGTAAATMLAVAPIAHAQEAGDVTACSDPSLPLSVEEQRLTRAVPQEILRLSRADRFGRTFGAALCQMPSPNHARVLVAAHGEALWRWAVARAQGRASAGELPAADDRPLYWARLQLTSAVRQWDPEFPLDEGVRQRLIESLERATRGQDAVDFPSEPGVQRVLVSGFDPFILDVDIRRSNPSGSAALALDGLVIDTASGPARVEAAMFPVLWQPFAEGMVERTFLPYVRDGRSQVDLFTTISQGRPERFDVERYNGRWRGGFIDNNNLSSRGVIPIPDGVPTVTPAPEFVPTTLPYQRMVEAETGRFPVYDNTAVTEIPAGGTEPVVSPNGPTPGSTARAGGGGNYLSNEISYRTTLLRDAVAAELPGGHLHTPVLAFDQGNTTEITDPVFERNRQDILDQILAIVTVAVSIG